MKKILFLIPGIFLFFGVNVYAETSYSPIINGGEVLYNPVHVEFFTDEDTNTVFLIEPEKIPLGMRVVFRANDGSDVLGECVPFSNTLSQYIYANTTPPDNSYGGIFILIFEELDCGGVVDTQEYIGYFPIAGQDFTVESRGVYFGDISGMVQTATVSTATTLYGLVPILAMIIGVALATGLVSSLFIPMFDQEKYMKELYKEGKKQHDELYKHINRNR